MNDKCDSLMSISKRQINRDYPKYKIRCIIETKKLQRAKKYNKISLRSKMESKTLEEMQ